MTNLVRTGDMVGNGLVIHRSRVWVLSGYYCAVALDMLFTPMCLSPNSIIWYWPRDVILCGWN